MRVLLPTCLLLALVAVPAAAQPPIPAEPMVTVTGEGVVKAAPDVAWVTFAVESRSKDPKAAQAQTAKAMTSVQQQLLAAGVPKDAIRTLSYDLHLESDWVDGKQVTRGYVARNAIEVRLDDLTRVGEIIDVAITNGATAVQNVRFDLKERESLEREALKRATADARARAEAAASGAGLSLARVMRIEEPGSGGGPQPPMPMMMRESAQDARAASTPVIPGELEIRAHVRLTATLK